jgi:serine/threonine-protein kinase
LVAIKMILAGNFASQLEKQRFHAEAMAAVQLNHSNIAPIYEMGEYNGMPYYSMKLIEGQTLSQRLLSGPLPTRRAAATLSKVCDAIQYAHNQGVLHRDIKPSNILVDEDGEPFVVDFGLAKRESDSGEITKSGAVLGTPSYMSPEQAAGARAQVGFASDVYSLGAVLYHMVLCVSFGINYCVDWSDFG